MNEIWKPIKGYEGMYEVSSVGEVRSCIRIIVDSWCTRVFKGKILNKSKMDGKQPYYYVTLSKQGIRKKYPIHRLVAQTFIPNPNDKMQVNHIDGNVHNNEVSNLEWATNAENTKHAYEHQLRKKQVYYITYNGETHTLMEWCKLLKLTYKKVLYRYHLGKSIELCFQGGDYPCQ